MPKLSEEIGRNYHTIDNDPYTWKNYSNVDVSTHKAEDGKWHVKVTSPEYPEHDQPLRKFADEESANFYAQQMSDRIMRVTLNEVRQLVRNLILETITPYDRCNYHSLGWIDDKGNFINLTETPYGHTSYLESIFPDKEDPGQSPWGWIKVSNAQQFWYQGYNVSDISESQVDGLIDVWIQCSKYSRWIKRDPETVIAFLMIKENAPIGDSIKMEKYTIGDFLEIFGTQQQVDRFYSFLLGE